VIDELRIQANPCRRVRPDGRAAREGGQVMLVQSGGVLRGQRPMCFIDGEYDGGRWYTITSYGT